MRATDSRKPKTESSDDNATTDLIRDLTLPCCATPSRGFFLKSTTTSRRTCSRRCAKRRRASSPQLGRQTLEQLVRNYEVAADERMPVCQDSGLTVVMLETGQDVHWVGGSLQEAIYDGVREGTRAGYLRWSVTGDPTRSAFARLGGQAMRGDDAPAVVHIDLVPGDQVRLTLASKGFGAENMSALRMLVPADGDKGIADFVVDTVDRAGANACPPVIVGVGVGGTFETAALLAKRAVLRPVTSATRAGPRGVRSRRCWIASTRSASVRRVSAASSPRWR